VQVPWGLAAPSLIGMQPGRATPGKRTACRAENLLSEWVRPRLPVRQRQDSATVRQSRPFRAWFVGTGAVNVHDALLLVTRALVARGRRDLHVV